MIIYLGDGDITRSASYLAGVLSHGNIPFARIDSSHNPPDDFNSTRYDGYILSDYPCGMFKPGQIERIRDSVEQGAGLLMIGGCHSFHGCGGEYNKSLLADILPIKMLQHDDRYQSAQPTMIIRNQSHQILDGLPWEKPPFITGFNRFEAKPGANTLLKCVSLRTRIVAEEKVADPAQDSVYLRFSGSDNKNALGFEERLATSLPSGDAVILTLTDVYPMLVVGKYGKGRVAALATDIAPHWVGGLIDWGRERIVQKLPGGNSVEFGNLYKQFVTQLIQWVSTPEPGV